MGTAGRQSDDHAVGGATRLAGRARGLFPSGSAHWSFRLLGLYYALYGSLALIVWFLYVFTMDASLWADGEGGPAWFPMAVWLAFGVGSLCAGIGLLRKWTWARWLGSALAVTFLADGVLRLDVRGDDLLSLLMFFAIPILTLALLLAPAMPRHDAIR